MGGWVERIPLVDWVLVAGALAAAAAAVSVARRGGRFRELPGWAGFWAVFSALLLLLDHASRGVALLALGLLMFAAVRGYFFVAPVRMHDRYAVLATYLAIPLALLAVRFGEHGAFLATVPVALFLVIPVFLAFGPAREGMLDSMGRTLLGAVFFVFCLAHLALIVDLRPELMPGQSPKGMPQLFGVLTLAAELPRRLAGDLAPGESWRRTAAGVGAGLMLAVAAGLYCGPSCGMIAGDAARAGVLVLVAATLGAIVSAAVARDLALTTTASRLGRGAILGRVVPMAYAAPVFYHYLSYFA